LPWFGEGSGGALQVRLVRVIATDDYALAVLYATCKRRGHLYDRAQARLKGETIEVEATTIKPGEATGEELLLDE
jgi:hypothetical protein